MDHFRMVVATTATVLLRVAMAATTVTVLLWVATAATTVTVLLWVATVVTKEKDCLDKILQNVTTKPRNARYT
jgi:heme exporter protein D